MAVVWRRNIFAPAEADIQRAVIDHWRAFALPDTLVAAIPNARAAGQAGLTRGLPDLLVLSPRLGAATGYIELKTEGGRLSPAQCDIRELIEKRGAPYRVTYGRDEPIDALEAWGATRPRAAA